MILFSDFRFQLFYELKVYLFKSKLQFCIIIVPSNAILILFSIQFINVFKLFKKYFM